MGGRSEKKATRTMSAAECDVAIGNCQAGFVEDCKDACECGDPDACDVAGETVSTPPTKKPASAPKFKTVEAAERWLEKKYAEHGGRWKFQATQEYKKVYPHLVELYERRAKQIEKEQKQVNIVKNPHGAGYVIQFAKTTNTYVGGGGLMGGMSSFDTVNKAVKEAKELGFDVVSKPKPTQKSKEKNGIKSITNNLPKGYEIRKWRHEDDYGHRMTSYAVYLHGKPVFHQNKTFSNLPSARKAAKEHADTERLRKQIREERTYFEKHGNLGKTGYIRKSKTVKTTKPKPASIPTIVSAEATPEMRDALTSAITEGFSGAPKRTTASRAEAEFAATALEWGKGKSIGTIPKKKPAKAKRVTKSKKSAAKPAARKTAKSKAAPKDIKLTAAQRKRLNTTGHVTVKRGGKYITITK